MAQNSIHNLVWGNSKYWSRYDLDTEDYLTFLLLQQDPSISARAIADQIGSYPSEITNRIKDLKKSGFLRRDHHIQDTILGERLVTEAEGIYIPQAIGLQRIHIIINEIASTTDLRLMEAYCEIHPYIHYHSVLYSNAINFYIQFDIPTGMDTELHASLKVLKQYCNFKDITRFENYDLSKNSFNFFRWNMNKNQWNIIDAEIQNSTRTTHLAFLWQLFYEEFDSPDATIPSTQFRHYQGNLDELDCHLIRELTINSNVVLKFLAAEYGKDISTISKRLKKIRNSVVPQQQLYFDRSIFDLNTNQIISAKFKKSDPVTSQLLHHFVNSGMVPFSSSLMTGQNDNSLLWHINTSPTNIMEFIRFALQHFYDVKIHQVDVQSAKLYYFNSKNYTENGWNTDSDYWDFPLRRLETINNRIIK